MAERLLSAIFIQNLELQPVARKRRKKKGCPPLEKNAAAGGSAWQPVNGPEGGAARKAGVSGLLRLRSHRDDRE